GKIGPDAGKAGAPALADLMRDSDCRLAALGALPLLKPPEKEAKTVVQRLLVVLDDKDMNLRTKVIETLGKLGKPAVIPLRDALRNDPSPLVRYAAATALGDIGPDAKDALQILKLRAEGDQEPLVRDAATKALNRVK